MTTLSFAILRNVWTSYYNENDQPEFVVPIEEVIAVMPTVTPAMKQSGSWEKLMDIIRG